MIPHPRRIELLKKKSLDDNERVVLGIITAHDETIIKQDEPNKIMDELEKSGNHDYRIKSMKWEEIDEQLLHCDVFLSSVDRRNYFGEEYAVSNQVQRIDKIHNDEIRFWTRMLLDVDMHYKNLQAAAKFFEILNASPKDEYAIYLFSWWANTKSIKQLINEIESSTDSEKVEDFKMSIKARSMMFDLFIGRYEYFLKIREINVQGSEKFWIA